MLHKRFLAPGLLSVLHFYFSAEFEDVQSHPAVRIVLPTNSRMTFGDEWLKSSRTRSLSIASKLSISSKLNIPGSAILQLPQSPTTPTVFSSLEHGIEGYGPNRQEGQVSGPVITSSWAAMHLSKVFSTVQGCKEAMWPEYRDLDGSFEDDEEENALELRKEFLAAWEHWERYAHRSPFVPGPGSYSPF